MNPARQPDRESRRREQRQRARDRARRQRLLLAFAVPAALVALIVGIKVGTPGSEDEVAASARKAEQAREAAARQRAREDRAIDRVLEYTTFVKEGRGRKRQVALTFDDGPGADTDAILRVLRRTGTPATFFVVGSSVPGREQTIRKIRRQGHAIGNHTLDHPGMGSLGAAEQVEQINRQAELAEAAGARKQRLFRPPYRSFNETTLEMLAERNLLMVLWSVDTNDYEGLGPQAIVRRALDEVKPGSIILMHDAGGDRGDTVRALPDIIKGLKRRNLRPVTVPRLVLDDPPPDDQPLPDGLSGG